MRTQNRHPSKHDKTPVELTEKELAILYLYYRDKVKERAAKNPSLAADYAQRMEVFRAAMELLNDRDRAEREERDRRVASFRKP
jgi:hypothetical protein